MGFDPRRWRPPPAGARPVTANVEVLLAENEALRREVLQLREQLERWRWDPDGNQGRRRQEAPEWDRVSRGQAPLVSPSMVERWMAAMACHSGWEQLRIGPPGGLRGLVERCRSRSWNPALSLEQELDRRQSGLGSDLLAALRGPHSRGRWAVRAAFALYGPAAIGWLNDEPLRVVAELLRLLQRLESQGAHDSSSGAAAGGGSEAGRRRGTRTANTSWAAGEPGGTRRKAADEGRSGSGTGRQRSGEGKAGTGSRHEQRSRSGPGSGEGGPAGLGAAEPVGRRDALRRLGLEEGASLVAIKRAYRTLAKSHHPDLGGAPEAFHHLDAAYRLLTKR